MKKMPILSPLSVLVLFSTTAFAGQKQPAPGPEFGESSIGLLVLGISAVAYAVYKFKNKK